MSEPKRVVIDPNAAILSGAELGRRERERLRLDDIDDAEHDAVVEIATPVVTSSFIRGLVGPSVRKLGFAKFAEKYRFDAEPSVRENILANARFAVDDPPE